MWMWYFSDRRGGRLSKRAELGGRSEKTLRTAGVTDDQKRCCERPGWQTIRKVTADGRGDILYTIHDDLFHAYGARCEIGLFSDSAPENRYSGVRKSNLIPINLWASSRMVRNGPVSSFPHPVNKRRSDEHSLSCMSYLFHSRAPRSDCCVHNFIWIHIRPHRVYRNIMLMK